tara:strand:+ start:158 stop:1063 length:906 start_codon:yes stop_codon:yes gene_type:complete
MQWIKNNTDIKFKKKVLIIGELIIDRSFKVINIGKSLETKNQKYFIENTKEEMGGAGKVYLSTKKLLKNNSILITSKYQKSKLSNDKNIYFYNSKIENIEKNRFWENSKKIIQFNKDYKKRYTEKVFFNKFLLKKLKTNINKINSIIISDYNHGLINSNIITGIRKLIKNKKIDVYIDKQIRSINEFPTYYKDLDYLVINELEFSLLKIKFKLKGNTINCLKRLKSTLKFKNIVLKKGKKGSCMINNKNTFFEAKSLTSKKIVDVSGAGDHFLAMFASLKNNISSRKRLLYSNKWASDNLK